MTDDSTPLFWWQTRGFAVLLIVLAGVPFWWPEIPPLIDLLGHMGRYRIQLDIGHSPFFERYYDFEWALIGNLGVDLLVQAIAPLIGLEHAVKLIITLVPMLTVAGMLLIAREVHGRLPATAAIALPLSLGYPIHFGFVNFGLSMALALLAFGLWLRLDRLGKTALREKIFVPIGCIVWLAHGFGWGVLGLLVFAKEWHKAGFKGVFHAGLRCLPLVPPLILMILWRGDGVTGTTGDWFEWWRKIAWLAAALRDEYMDFDMGSVVFIGCVFFIAALRWGLKLNPMMAIATVFLIAAFAALPRVLMGSAYADMRLVPYMLAIAILAVGTATIGRRMQTVFAVIAVSFFLLRTGIATRHFIEIDKGYDAQLAALDHLPRNQRVFTLVNLPCQGQWTHSRMDHLSSISTVRRDAFVNDQWVMAGAQLLRVTYPEAGAWATDPTQIIRPLKCRQKGGTIYEEAMAQFPRAAYDYVWLIDFPPDRLPSTDKGLSLVWRGEKSGALYRIGSATQASDTPKGKDARVNQ